MKLSQIWWNFGGSHPDHGRHCLQRRLYYRIGSTMQTFLREDPAYSYTILAKRLGVSKKTIFMKIKALKEKRIIERIGSDRKGYWKINE